MTKLFVCAILLSSMQTCIWPLRLSYHCQRQLDTCLNNCPEPVHIEEISGMDNLFGGKVSSNPCRDHCYDQANRCDTRKREPRVGQDP